MGPERPRVRADDDRVHDRALRATPPSPERAQAVFVVIQFGFVQVAPP